MEKKLGLGTSDSYQLAKDIYQQGAHSKSFAEVTITGGASGTIPAGAKVVGKTSSGAEVRGKVLDEVASGATTLKIQYKTTDIQDSYVDCQVGALGADGNTNGCFAASGTVEIDGFEPITYTYTVPEDSNNGRTIAGFSTGAKAKMYECDNCPYVDYKKFFDYYGSFDYANQWVLAAFSGGKTSFQNGNADFGEFTFAGRTESIKKGTAYMNVWMYVIREMEDALDDCKSGCIDCNDDPVHAWDEVSDFNCISSLLFRVSLTKESHLSACKQRVWLSTPDLSNLLETVPTDISSIPSPINAAKTSEPAAKRAILLLETRKLTLISSTYSIRDRIILSMEDAQRQRTRRTVLPL